MNLKLYLENESFDFEQISASENLQDRIHALELIRSEAIKVGDKIFKDEGIYEVKFNQNEVLCQWLFSRDIKLKDERKLLMKLIEQGETITKDTYSQVSVEINQLVCHEPKAFLDLHYIDDSILRVRCTDDLALANRFYLRKITSIEEFVDVLGRCFPNLAFHPDVVHSLKTLTASFSSYITEIIHHLSALNDEFGRIFRQHKHKGIPTVMEIFQARTQIASSGEGNPQSAKKRLTFTFQANDNSLIDLVCEPHTKLEGTSASGDSRYRFDRIYFHPGRPDIQSGRILIAYIGKHL